MSVHELSEHKQARAAYVPNREKNWRKKWRRLIYWPTFDAMEKVWGIHSVTMIAAHGPSKAAFQLDYGPNDLLRTVRFMSSESETPSVDWKLNGPEMRELISQITELYLQRW